jgi:UPF0271 protein
MTRTVQHALAQGVDVGAHVGFPDREGFGRRAMQMSVDELKAMVTYQLGALAGICQAANGRMTHMSFHGALGNMVAADGALADALISAVAAFDASLLISTSSSQAIESAARRHGLQAAVSFLADRAYGDEGLLIPRAWPDSVIHDEAQLLSRVRQLLRDGTVTTYSGKALPMAPKSILVHGDTPGALSLAKAIRTEIEAQGGVIVPLSQQAL